MTFKCKHCGWTLDSGSFHMSADEGKEISEHINTCPVKPWSKVLEEKWKKAEDEAVKETVDEVERFRNERN